ncbi:nuclease A inhibitor family protein [Aliterella atlantica]|uniref:Uncharacterized protein n=1 Tax=Aliterella atlantica CENA595 TaxID=1618023 RepID=A0A0D8ZP42_9CYAN|nr:nuclease A inhibitor family protein [Aliterella atlantica]KJH70234.1 hypothetical protein UH38_18945 [Aliterella atlantica CENA595]
MPKAGFELFSTLRQNIVSPRTFNKAIAPFLILLVGQVSAFTPVAYSQPVNPISQNDAKCAAQMRLLLKASEGLLYPSESDYPFTYFSFSNTSKLPKPQRFLQLIRQTGQPIEQVSFDDLFNRLTRIEPGMDEQQIKAAKRYRVLEKVFRATFRDLTVYRVGTIQVQLYITGVNACGVSGLQTISIET